MPETCNAMTDEPGPLQWRCNLRPHQDGNHASVSFGNTYHQWTDPA
jgi:hypothetical protein